MGDLPYIDRTDEVKIVGQDSTGNRANYVGADANGNLTTKDFADGTPGAPVPSVAIQVAGSDGTNLQPVSTDTTGKVNINNISGTVSLPSGASTSANQTNGNQQTQIVQGGNTAVVKQVGTGVVGTDNGLVTNSVIYGVTTGGGGGYVEVKVNPSGSLETVANQGDPNTLSNKWPVQVTDGTNTMPTMDVASRAGFQKVTDGTNTAAVKAASTPAAAGDPSLVVGLSPNSPLPAGTNAIGTVKAQLQDNAGTAITLGQKAAASSVPVVTQADASPATINITAQDTASTSTSVANSQVFVTGTPTANSAASFAISSFESISVQVTGTWTGTLVIEVSIDGGTTWISHAIKQNGIQYLANSFTANFQGDTNVAGHTNFRVRSTAAWTGTATVLVVESVNPSSVVVSNAQTLRDSSTQSILNTIKAASTAAATGDTALVTALSPNTPLPAGTNSIGTVKAQLQDNAGTGVTLGQKAMTSSLPVVIASDQTHFPIELQDGSGNAITSTSINSKQRLDVNLPSEGNNGSTAPGLSDQVGGVDKNGKLQPFSTDTLGVLQIRYANNNGQLDAFSRLRVAEPRVIFNSTFTYDLQPNYWSTSVTGTGTVTSSSNISSAVIAVSAANDVAIIESKRVFIYSPGVSRNAYFTGKFGTATANVIQRIGMFDANDGVFFELNGTTLNAVIRSSTSGSPVDTDIAQSTWNTDKLDGTGPSGYTLDLTKGQVMHIDYAWLGWNKVRFGFIINGELIVAHVATFSNNSTVPWASTGHLNFRAEVRTTVTASVSMQFTCVSILDGGAVDDDQIKVPRSVSTTTLKSVSPATLTPILSIRLDPTKPKSIIIPNSYTVISSGGDGGASPYEIRIVLNPTLTAASFGAITNSNAQFDTAATSMSGGIQLDTVFASASNYTDSVYANINPDVSVVLNFDDLNSASDILTLAIFSQSPVSVLSAIDWTEE